MVGLSFFSLATRGRVDIVKNTKIAIQVAKTMYDLVFAIRLANNCSIIGCHCANFLGFILEKVQFFLIHSLAVFAELKIQG